MNSLPLVTISSAAYNTGPKILNMLKSVFSQSFTAWELILIDDGSTNDTFEIMSRLDDPRVRVFKNGKNIGRSKSLNKVTSLARGKYIARMDSDDLCNLTRIEKQVKLIESNPAIDVVSTGIIYLNSDELPVGHCFAPPEHDKICEHPTKTIGVCHGAILAKKVWFQKNPYDESVRYAIDLNLLFRTYKHSVFSNVSEPLYYYTLENSYSLKKQFIARKVTADIFFKTLWSEHNYAKAAIAAFKQYGKFAATAMMCAAGMKDKLLARRFKPLEESYLSAYTKELKTIKACELPMTSK